MARRKTEVFSMSFLDCITCAFGSVVLVYTLINAKGGLRQMAQTENAQAQLQQLEQQVLEGYQRLYVLRNSLLETDEERVRTEGMGTRVLEEAERLKLELADAEKETLSRREAIERLKADLKRSTKPLDGWRAPARASRRPAHACAALPARAIDST
jgi:chromosome segregation ATPase